MQPCLWQPIPNSRTEPGREHKYAFPFLSPSFSPTDRRIAFACDRVRLFNVDTGAQHGAFPEKANYPKCVCFAPDGQKLVSGHEDGDVIIWRVDGQRVRRLTGHGDHITALAVSPDGKLLASASDDGSVRLWDFPAGTPRQVFSREWRQPGGWQRTPYLAFMPDSLQLLSFHDPEAPGTVRLWHAESDEMGPCWSPIDRQLSCVALAPDGELLASGEDNGRVTLWNRSAVLNDSEVSRPAPPDASRPQLDDADPFKEDLEDSDAPVSKRGSSPGKRKSR
jgi:WD40 repeat protein